VIVAQLAGACWLIDIFALKPETFNCLGLTHFVTRSSRGRFVVGRKTQRARLRKKLKELGVRLDILRTRGGRAMMEYVQQPRGHFQYFGVSRNSRSLRQYLYASRRRRTPKQKRRQEQHLKGLSRTFSNALWMGSYLLKSRATSLASSI
jgi:hypothetical protein